MSTKKSTAMTLMEQLYQSISQRKRPEDVADLILRILHDRLDSREKKILKQAARGSLRNSLYRYTSMLEAFAKPVGAEKQIRKAREIFDLEEGEEGIDYSDPMRIEAFLDATAPIIRKGIGKNHFVSDRLNREERKAMGMELSKRQYNKRWRLLKRIEQKLSIVSKEQKKREYQQTAKNGLARKISKEDFFADTDTACFIAYYTSRANLRSEFTIDGQQRAFDQISEMLMNRCGGQLTQYNRIWQAPQHTKSSTNWWAIAHVYPSVFVLNQLDDEQKGQLLGIWTNILEELAMELKQVWKANSFNRRTMIVKRGDDSSTWNQLAGAWNKARDNWINLLYASGLDYVLDGLCFGKVMRLMAADVAWWHRTAGHSPEPNTQVWNQLPFPWEVFSGRIICDQYEVIAACRKAGLDPKKSGWIAPRVQKVATFKPTPELVHGVAVQNPFLAKVLKAHKYYSGKQGKILNPSEN